MSLFGIQEIIAIGGTVAFNSLAQILLRVGLKDTDIGGMISERALIDLAQTLLRPAILGGIGCFVFGLAFLRCSYSICVNFLALFLFAWATVRMLIAPMSFTIRS